MISAGATVLVIPEIVEGARGGARNLGLGSRSSVAANVRVIPLGECPSL